MARLLISLSDSATQAKQKLKKNMKAHKAQLSKHKTGQTPQEKAARYRLSWRRVAKRVIMSKNMKTRKRWKEQLALVIKLMNKSIAVKRNKLSPEQRTFMMKELAQYRKSAEALGRMPKEGDEKIVAKIKPVGKKHAAKQEKKPEVQKTKKASRRRLRKAAKYVDPETHQKQVDKFRNRYGHESAYTSITIPKQGSKEAQRAAHTMAADLHDEWQRKFKLLNGNEAKKTKTTDDKEWIKKNGTNKVDLANTKYQDLPSDWKKHHLAEAIDTMEALQKVTNNGADSIHSHRQLEDAATQVHSKWLKRNSKKATDEQRRSFKELPDDEAQSHRDKLKMAANVLAKLQGK